MILTARHVIFSYLQHPFYHVPLTLVFSLIVIADRSPLDYASNTILSILLYLLFKTL